MCFGDTIDPCDRESRLSDPGLHTTYTTVSRFPSSSVKCISHQYAPRETMLRTSKMREEKTLRRPMPRPSSSCRHPTQSACTASTLAVPLSCTACTLISAQPSWLSWPSCERRASFDHRNRTVCDHNDAFPERTAMPCRPCTV